MARSKANPGQGKGRGKNKGGGGRGSRAPSAKADAAAGAKAGTQPDEAKSAAARPSEGAPRELSREDKRALLIAECVEIEKRVAETAVHEKAKKTLGGEIRVIRKRMIGYGFTTEQIDYALRLRAGDEKAELQRHQGERDIAQMLDHVVWRQTDLFDAASDRTPSVDRAHEEGRIAGFEGKSCEPPTHYGQEQQQSWIAGWHKGQEELVLAKLKTKPQAPAAPAGGEAASFDDALPTAQGAQTAEADGAANSEATASAATAASVAPVEEAPAEHADAAPIAPTENDGGQESTAAAPDGDVNGVTVHTEGDGQPQAPLSQEKWRAHLREMTDVDFPALSKKADERKKAEQQPARAGA